MKTIYRVKIRAAMLATALGTSSMLPACDSELDIPSPPADSSRTAVTIRPDRELQTIDGFGASDAWRCQMVGRYWPEAKKDTLADLLFSRETDENGNPKGIGLSLWRFYLGAGSMEQGAGSEIADEWRRAECFQAPDGTYDWNKQAGQRWFLQAARRRGVEKFLAFTLSAPVHMTLNGKAFSSRKQKMNIREDRMAAYADFLATCLENLQKNEGIAFDYLSPVNEPQWDWMAGDNGKASQEGTPATNEELYRLTSLLSRELQARRLPTRIALGEAGSINYLYEDVNSEKRDDQIDDFWNPASPLCIASLPNLEYTVTGHSYFTVWPFNDQIRHRQRLDAKVRQYAGLKYWQTEYCILENPGEEEIPGGAGNRRDLGMKTALFVSRIIHNDLTVANASSWQWWTALSRADYKDGLIYLDDGASNGGQSPGYCKKDGYIRPSKLLWALGNYSFFIRPGMKRIEAAGPDPAQTPDGLLISAYTDAATKKIVIVAVNPGDKMRICRLDTDGRIKNRALVPYTTSGTSDLERGNEMPVDRLAVPPESVVTFVGTLE